MAAEKYVDMRARRGQPQKKTKEKHKKKREQSRARNYCTRHLWLVFFFFFFGSPEYESTLSQATGIELMDPRSPSCCGQIHVSRMTTSQGRGRERQSDGGNKKPFYCVQERQPPLPPQPRKASSYPDRASHSCGTECCPESNHSCCKQCAHRIDVEHDSPWGGTGRRLWKNQCQLRERRLCIYTYLYTKTQSHIHVSIEKSRQESDMLSYQGLLDITSCADRPRGLGLWKNQFPSSKTDSCVFFLFFSFFLLFLENPIFLLLLYLVPLPCRAWRSTFMHGLRVADRILTRWNALSHKTTKRQIGQNMQSRH